MNEIRRFINSGNKSKCYIISLFELSLLFDIEQEIANLHPPLFTPDYDLILEKRHELYRQKCKEHFTQRKKEIDALSIPKNFMIAYRFELGPINHEYIKDLDMIVALLGRTSGGIYIPGREIDLDTYPFDSDIYFVEDEFNER